MNKKILVADSGAFISFAQALTDYFDQILYYSPNPHFMPTSQDSMIGRGMEGIERVDSFWSYLEKVDCVAFSDVGQGDLQHWLRERAFPVWGSGKAEILELDRWQFRKMLGELGEATPDTTHVVGMDAIRKELKKREDVYIKTSWFRGDFETHHFSNYKVEKPWLDELELRLGPHSSELEILIEEPIESDCEIGYDGFSIDGRFPKSACYGYELKDKGYIGKGEEYEAMPEQLRKTNAAIAPALKSLGCRGNFHTEVRVADENYLLDPCLRPGSPPCEVMTCMIENWGEIVYGGSHGKIVEPKFAGKYGAQIILKSDWNMRHWLAVGVPKEFEQYLKLRRGVKHEGVFYNVPADDLELVGSACGIGDTPEQAVEMAQTVAESIDALEISFEKNCGDKLMELVEKGNAAMGDTF